MLLLARANGIVSFAESQRSSVPNFQTKHLFVIMTRAQAARHTMSLESYDRFFPNQDYLPKGGFGNLIALPLQKTPRDNGNSIFLDEDLKEVSDQWELLSKAHRISREDLRILVSQYMQQELFSLVKFEDVAVSTAERAFDAGGKK
jgi:hypothetical protein